MLQYKKRMEKGMGHAPRVLKSTMERGGAFNEEEILREYTPEEQEIIRDKQAILSSLAYFIGKDLVMPVQLNKKGGGWHWDFKNNVIRIDPQTLLDKPLVELRYLMCHEGGHRRITRADFIPREEWSQPGFSALMNFIEDPRNDNFIEEVYPRYGEGIDAAWGAVFEKEKTDLEKEAEKTLGKKPRFVQAGYEYIRHWFYERQGKPTPVDESLPPEVTDVVTQTLDAARDSWFRYPSRIEADTSEELIQQYAHRSYEINRDEIWPLFKTLVDQDVEDQKMQEALKNEQGESDIPQDLQDTLTEEERELLEDLMTDPDMEIPGVIDLDKMSESLKKKIIDYIESLPEEVRQMLQEKAEEILKAFEKKVNEELLGVDAEESEEGEPQEDGEVTEEPKERELPPVEHTTLKTFKERLEKELEKDANVYEEERRKVLPIIDRLEMELRELFVARRASTWKTGFKQGKRIDIKKRIQEKAKKVSAVESHAWQKREMPKEKDYAISLLVDLSGSMSGQRIEETFKAVIVLTEVLNRLSINLEVLGFNDQIYEYQNFGQGITKGIRENMGGMLGEVRTHHGAYNDDGWAVEQSVDRVRKQKADHKFLLVLSDGEPWPSPAHGGWEYDLETIVEKIMKETDVHVVGLGIGEGTSHVAHYYPHSLANVPLEEMAKKIAGLLKDMIEHYDAY